jgi:hypothetical protein
MWYMDKKQAGKLGGQAWTMAKANAARVNGALGGRPRTRSWWQVLRRSDAQLTFAFYKLSKIQQGKLQRYFGMPFVNFCLPAQRPATKRTPAVRAALRELLQLAKGTTK